MIFLKIIAQGGVATKNTLINTKGAITLSLSTPFVDGIDVNVAYTVDNVFVIVDEATIDFTTEGLGYIQNNTYNDLLHYNTGTKVLRAIVVTLNEVLEIYKESNKILILNLRSQGERTKQYIEQLLALINNYPNINIYLTSRDTDVLKILRESDINFKIGARILGNNINEWSNNNYDFYIIATNRITRLQIINKLNMNKEVMTELIQYPGDLTYAYNQLGNIILDQMYVITYNPKIIDDAYNNLKR